MGSICQLAYPLFQIRHSGILYTCIVGTFDAIAKDIRHLLGVTELERHVMIDRYGERAIGILPHIGGVDGYCLFLHHHLNIEFGGINQSGAKGIFNGFVGGIHL